MESRINELGPGDIRQRLSQTAPPENPTAVLPPAGNNDWRHALLQTLDQPLIPSAVLVPIVARDSGLTVLLTERAADLAHHPGQISFPGGRVEGSDRDLVHTALRETEEEVGIAASHVEVTGYLSPLPTVTGYAVTPVVGLVDPAAELTLDAREVASAFEVPLSFLLEPGNQEISLRDYNGVEIPVIAFHYQNWRIWGATAAMIVLLKDKLL